MISFLLFIFLETGFGSLVSYLGFKVDCLDLIGFGGEIYPPQPIARVNHPDSPVCTSLHLKSIMFSAALEPPYDLVCPSRLNNTYLHPQGHIHHCEAAYISSSARALPSNI